MQNAASKLKELVRNAADSDIGIRVERAIDQLCFSDSELLGIDVAERAISHRLAGYLQHEFPSYHVDCEYNRDGTLSKRLNLNFGDIASQDLEAKTVFPDVIVHRRQTSENLLVIEMKKSSSSASRKNDYEKLSAFRKAPYHYEHALFLLIGPEGLADFEWNPDPKG